MDERVGLPVEQIFKQAPSMRHPEWVTRLWETFTAERPASGAYTIFDRQGQLVYHSLETPLTCEQRSR